MKRFAVVLVFLIGMFVSAATAQDTSANPATPPAPQSSSSSSSTSNQKIPATPATPAFDVHEVPKSEISAGYVLRGYSVADNSSIRMNGGFVSYDRNIFSWLGIDGEGLAVFKSQGSQSTGPVQKWALFTAMGGPQIYPLRHRKLTPFVHTLFGVGYYDETESAFGGFGSAEHTSTAFAYEAGGGLDLRIRHHWSVRLFEAGFGQTSFFGGHPGQSSYRISVGVTYLRFGDKGK